MISLLTTLRSLFIKRICKRAGSPHPSTPPDHPGGHAVSGANPGPSCCSPANARTIPFGHACQRRELRKFERWTTNRAPKEETTGVMNDLFVDGSIPRVVPVLFTLGWMTRGVVNGRKW